jgi:uncharacterized protein YegL
MKKILGTLLVVTVLLLTAHFSLAGQSQGNRIMFLIQTDRDKATLENDAELVWQAVKNAKNGDYVEGMTLSGQRVFSVQMTKKSPMDARRDRNMAGAAIKQFYLDHINSPRKQNRNDVAGAIKRTMGRFNAESQKERYVLVMLTGGLQKDSFVDFGKGYPSDSWIVHQWSPYSAIPQNTTGKMMDVVFVSQNGDFQSSYQAQRVERFYSLLFSRKRAELTGFTDDHQTVGELIRHSRPLSKPVPQPEGMNGQLFLYKLDGQKQIIEKSDQPKQSSLNTRPESYIACSVLMRKVDKGLASIWVSMDLKKKPARGFQASDFRVYEVIDNQRRLIPSDDITVQSDRPPLAVVLARDVSPSMSKVALQQSNDAIYTFVDMLGENDKVGLVSFASTARAARKLTDNKDKLKKSVKNPLIRLGGTSLYDAIILALTCVQKDKGECLRVVVTFTDGEDTFSRSTVSDVIAAAKAASTPVFLVGVGKVDVPVLQSIAKGTGGIYYPASDAGAMRGIYEGISRLFTNSLVISYPTSAKNNAQVDVAVADR